VMDKIKEITLIFRRMPRISIVVPVYYNELNLPHTLPRLVETLNRMPDMQGEIICVDDGSGDRSFEVMREFAARDPRIKLVRLAKNFGAHTAMLAGIDHASGDCILIISADLQDPPELIVEMTQKWRAGAKIVLAERAHREDHIIDRAFSGLFWKFMRRFAIPTLPKGGFDFVLFDRRVAEVLKASREKNSHIMTQIFWTGFPAEILPYTRQKREHGVSRWTFSKKLKLFIDSAIAFTSAPIRFISLTGIVTSIVGFLFALLVIWNRIAHGTPVVGWSSLMVVILVIGGLQMLILGVIGEYLWRTYDEARNRPSYVVAERRNFEQTDSTQV